MVLVGSAIQWLVLDFVVQSAMTATSKIFAWAIQYMVVVAEVLRQSPASEGQRLVREEDRVLSPLQLIVPTMEVHLRAVRTAMALTPPAQAKYIMTTRTTPRARVICALLGTYVRGW